jgi:hypothetical protein
MAVTVRLGLEFILINEKTHLAVGDDWHFGLGAMDSLIPTDQFATSSLLGRSSLGL